MNKCNNNSCTLKKECLLAQLKNFNKTVKFEQIAGDCPNFTPIKKK